MGRYEKQSDDMVNTGHSLRAACIGKMRDIVIFRYLCTYGGLQLWRLTTDEVRLDENYFEMGQPRSAQWQAGPLLPAFVTSS
ncbi:hypothetical protein [Leisingera methylohalidivorans]|uniref:hypothetical protein n=1 Tax=Leisingera methylohalidivorans TaxID=133924 RepID=UPI0012EB59B8|nr:hypothetical protein [Leisingera methylohalidivorans]